MRGLGLSELFAAASDAFVVTFAVLTQLGDPWFLFVTLALFYWLASDRLAEDPRRTGALLIAFALGALVLTIALKSLFALPRPPGAAEVEIPVWLPVSVAPVFQNIATGTGFGFPSGHALGTTVAYGALAALLDVSTRTRRWLVAAGIVVLVSLSRLVLGVHYLVDVLVGAGVGLVFLALALRVADGRPDRAFGVAAVVSVLAVVATALGGHPVELREAVSGLGAALGGLLAWRRVGATTTPLTIPVALVGIVLSGGLWVGARRLDPPLVATAVVYALAVGLVIAYPSLVASVGGKRNVVSGDSSR